MRKKTDPRLAYLGTAGLLLALSGGLAMAGSVTYDFSTDPAADPDIQIVGNNPLPWQETGGKTGGFLAITYAVDSQNTTVVFPDIDPGKVVTAFKFEADLRVGNSSDSDGRPADGFSISFARGTDPILSSPSTSGNFAGGLPEAGTATGIAVSFDTWSGNALPDTSDIEGIMVRVDNKTVLKKAMSTRNGACDDTTTLQTGNQDAAYWSAGGDATMPEAWTTLCWQPLTVELAEDGKLTVTYKGAVLLDKYQTKYFPSAGRLVLSGRTGGNNEHTHIDNIKLTTTAVAPDTVNPTAPANPKVVQAGAYRAVLSWDAATDDSGRVGYEVEQDGTVLPTNFVEPQAEITGLTPSTTYAFRVRAKDPFSNVSDWVSISATTVADVTDTNYAAIKIYGTSASPIANTPVADLLADSRYPDSPDRVAALKGVIMSFGEPGFGETFGDNIGFRLAGTVTPPATGRYQFFVRADDTAELYLNTTGSSIPVADGASYIATEASACCEAFKEQTDPVTEQPFETSDYIQLTAGKSYGILLLVKEATGGDWAQVAWRMEGDKTAASALTPIAAPYFVPELSPKVDPVGAEIEITQQPANKTVEVGSLLTNAVIATITSPYTSTPTYQWFKNGSVVPGATASTYTFAATSADNGAKIKARIIIPGKAVESSEATITVLQDTTPPVPTAAAISTGTGAAEVGVGFNEALDSATAGAQSNYTLSKGTVQSFTYYAQSGSALLKVSGLNAGDSVTVTVKNVADVAGNKITSVDLPVTVSGQFKWGVVGGNELNKGNYVVPVAANGFDVFSDGVGEWGTYDEATFVYEQVTGNFDKKLRVEYQDASSQWARAGLIARDVTNFGVDRATQEGGAAGRYQKVHVNPVGPTLTGPGTPGNAAWEGNQRLTTGAATTTAGGGGTPQYPNAWCRLQRKGETFTIFRSDDGVNWVQLGTSTFDPAMPATLFVGPEYSPENLNITEETARGIFVAKFRDYGDTFPPYSIGLNFGASQAGGSLTAGDVAGVAKVAQPNWNNLNDATGSTNKVVANVNGATEEATVTVTWSSANLWSSTGAGEENNQLPGADKTLMTGYLDTGNATTTTVTITNIPSKLASEGFDVYVYTLGGVAGGRSGGYRVLDAATGTVLKDWVFGTSPVNPTAYGKTPVSRTASAPGVGTYILFNGIKASGIIIEASTANGLGGSDTPRAPINAVQLVTPATQAEPEPTTANVSIARSTSGATITFTGTLESADSVTGPWTPVGGATSPYAVTLGGTAKFYRAK